MKHELERARWDQSNPEVVAKTPMSNKGGARGDRIEVSVKGISEVTPIRMCLPTPKECFFAFVDHSTLCLDVSDY